MAQQVRVRACTLNSIMRTREFRLGVEDFLAGRALRDDRDVVKTAGAAQKKASVSAIAWNYERGRQFAAALVGRGKAIADLDGILVAALAPQGGRVDRTLQAVCSKMMDAKEIL